MPEPSLTRILRRTLEGALDTRAASAILFEALSAAGNRVPQTRAEVLAVVRGPLHEVLARRFAADVAEELVGRIEEELAPRVEDPVTLEQPLDELAAETRRDDATATFHTADGVVPVLVVAAGRGFESRLAVALGERRAAPFTVSSHEALGYAMRDSAPPVFLVDASDFPRIDTRHLLAAGAALPPTTTCVLWGAELPYGKSFARAITTQERPWVTLELREGIAPLLDLIRSRRRNRRT